ncbi:MAG: chemotaxis protein CheW [Thermoguttaceae bacterium]|jgi:two-component system chemotaxis sensor kinase CheA
MTAFEDKEIVAEFVVESRERLADVENQLLAIETAGSDLDVELVNEVFRAVHSIKGAAGFLGFETLSQLAHSLENVLNLVRNRQLVPDGQVTDVLLRSADTLRKMIDDVEHSNEVEISEYLDLLQQIVAGLAAEESGQKLAPERPPQTDAADAAEANRGSNANRATPVKTPVRSNQGDETADGSTHATEPQTPTAAPAAVPKVGKVEPSAVRSTPADTHTSGAVAPVETNIRVSVAVLDRLMNLAGELVLARNRLLQTVNNADHRALDTVASRVDQVTSELQETIMQTRLQMVGNVFNKFPRVVRDLSNTLGKQCQLTLEGQEVELDKSIIEAISDPLTHLIRNAVDHGLELPEDRVRAGKAPVGTINLRAFHQAGKVNLSISDDGRGIDAARIREKVIAQGVLPAEQVREMSDREILQIIFRPGFSLAKEVTQVSGRGVGMDVVKTNIEKLGGTVTIDTQVGIGTTFTIKLPLTLAIVPALVVRCEGRRFAVPQASINELVRVKASEASARIQRIKNAEVLRLRGSLLPLVRLSTALGLGETATPCDHERVWNVIVVEAGHLRYGLIVDGLHDSEEIVVKPLGRHLKDAPCLAGATILGDGTVALILDVATIASHCHLEASVQEEAKKELPGTASGPEMQSVLLFHNAPTEQFATPMQLIDRLERIDSEQIESVGGQKVLQYRGMSLPLLCLEDHIHALPRPQAAEVFVVVFKVAGREVGLLAPDLVDIYEIPVTLDTVMFREPGVLGSTVVDGKTTRLIDLCELTKTVHPQWLEHGETASRCGKLATILVAEDSEFFRRQLSSFLETAGYEVVACEDGLVAWNTLQMPDRHVDLVVTDLEMPNVNGLELTRKIKEHPALAHLPVIAVTSLASEEDRRRGQEAGVDEYHVKLDRERLISSVERFMAKAKHRDANKLVAAAREGRNR